MLVGQTLQICTGAARDIDSHNIRSSPVLQVDDELLFGPELGPEKIDELLGLD